MTDHATATRPATDRPETGRDAGGQSPNPRYVPLPDGSLFDIAECHGLTPGERPRCDGWTADRQRRFLIALSRGLTVDRACAIVEMSRTAAYTFRASARGSAFALGWEAAQIRARDVLADELMDRALNGVREQVITDDGRITTRKRHDNRLAWNLLTRLDRACDPTKAAPRAHAAALAAQDFEHYLDVLEESGPSGGPARAGLFLAARISSAADPAAAAQELEPVRALARADRWVRTHAHDSEATAPAPDPAARADWTAADWARAESLGLVTLAPAETVPPENLPACQPCQLVQESPDPALDDPWLPEDNPDRLPVWRCSVAEDWRTNLAPPPDFIGEEEGEWGYSDYCRSLDADELDAVEAGIHHLVLTPDAHDHATRDAFFAALTDPENPPLSGASGEQSPALFRSGWEPDRPAAVATQSADGGGLSDATEPPASPQIDEAEGEDTPDQSARIIPEKSTPPCPPSTNAPYNSAARLPIGVSTSDPCAASIASFKSLSISAAANPPAKSRSAGLSGPTPATGQYDVIDQLCPDDTEEIS